MLGREVRLLRSICGKSEVCDQKEASPSLQPGQDQEALGWGEAQQLLQHSAGEQGCYQGLFTTVQLHVRYVWVESIFGEN